MSEASIAFYGTHNGVGLEHAHKLAVSVADDICALSAQQIRGDWWWRIYYREFFARTRP